MTSWYSSLRKMSIITRKDRVAACSQTIEEKWEEYWWMNMMRLAVEIDGIGNYMNYLSCSPHITQKRVESKMDMVDWDFNRLYANGIIDDEFAKKHGIVLSREFLYKKLTFENMHSLLPDFEIWHPSDVTGVMPLSEIDAHMDDYPWSWRILMTRSDITLDFAEKWYDIAVTRFGVKGSDFNDALSLSNNITIVDIKKHEAFWLKHVNWKVCIYYNASLRREIVHEYFEKICLALQGSFIYTPSFLKHLTFEMYLCYIGQTGSVKDKVSLDKLLLTDNIYQTLNNVLTRQDYQFDLFQRTGDVNLSIVEKYPYITWNCNELASNLSNTMETFEKYKYMFDGWNIITVAFNLTFDYLIEHKDAFIEFIEPDADNIIMVAQLFQKEYPYEKKCFTERKQREYMAAYRIQQWWIKVTSHPENAVCQRRLENEYDVMVPNRKN